MSPTHWSPTRNSAARPDASRSPAAHRRARWLTCGALLAVAAAAGLLTSACKKDLPPSLPRTQIYQRFVPRVELVELAVSDQQKSERIRSLYIDIEKIFYEQAVQAGKDFESLNAKKGKELSEEEFRGVFDAFRKGEKKAYHDYIDVQMKLRQSMTAEEFADLNKLR